MIQLSNLSKKQQNELKEFLSGNWEYDSLGNCVLAISTGDRKVVSMVADIRGWGFLTGKGALGLDEEDATVIQDGVGRIIQNSMRMYKILEEVAKEVDLSKHHELSRRIDEILKEGIVI